MYNTIKSMRDDALLSPQDVGELVGVPTTTVYQWNSRGVGPKRIRVGKHIRYRRSDVEAWLNQHTVDNVA